VSAPVLTAITVAANPAAWAAAGFSVQAKAMVVGTVSIEFVDGDSGIVDWTLAATKGDGARSLQPPAHPNRVTEIDHVVMLTPDLERKITELEEGGIELRRRREGETGMGTYRQAFFRLGRPILEVVEAEGPERLWGITFTTEDIDAAAELLGDKLGRVKDAVQPGRRIATLRREAGLGLPVALISPKPRDP
jgi:hypothetical protein